MNTPRFSPLFRHPATRRIVATATLVLFPALGLATTDESAAPGESDSAALPADPYAAYLDALGTQWPELRLPAQAVKSVMRDQAALLATFARTPESAYPDYFARMDGVRGRLEQALAALDDASKAMRDALPPREKIELPRFDPDAYFRALRAARRGAAPPPVLVRPCNLDVPEVGPTEAERNYLAYLKARAGNTEFASAFLANARDNLDERRELSVRFLRAEPGDRPDLTIAMEAVTSMLDITERAIIEARSLAVSP